VRNVKPMWSKWGLMPSLALGGLDMWTNSIGFSVFGTMKHGKTDAAATGEAKQISSPSTTRSPMASSPSTG
jgi:electron-transferring-flavoprotein dehydrogenase